MDAAPLLARAPARVGLLGNPSDLYGGAVLGFALDDFGATVTLSPGGGGPPRFEGPAAPLLAAAWARLERRGIEPLAEGFRLSADTDVPRQVGLSGSSALVVAALRVLLGAHGLRWSAFELSEEALLAETEELGIVAGPQDRVLQAHGGLLFMDFQGERRPEAYRPLDPTLLPPLVVAWDPEPGQDSGATHQGVRERWLAGDPEVRTAMERAAALAREGARALEGRDTERLADLVDANFELRRGLFGLEARACAPVEWARSAGAAAKFCGSGGAVVCVPRAGSSVVRVLEAFARRGWPARVPTVAPPGG
ncbi:MAG: hypothetical protein ISQ08_08710 [Planctomycetes bacterium]|nr:hypothetical protein [Planctomycetota bacterium]